MSRNCVDTIGLYRAEKSGDLWSLSRTEQVDEGRVFAVCDRFPSTSLAASSSAPFLEEVPIGGRKWVLTRTGFDFHFTPGKKSIGGVMNLRQAWNAESDAELEESATRLAHTMQASQDKERICWISVQGGSGVLTQAMKLLSDQNVSFENSDHYVFFSRLTTLAVPAEKLAREIGMKFYKASKYACWPNVNESIGGLALGFGERVTSIFSLKKD